MLSQTCVLPEGRFVVGIHEPSFFVENMREKDWIASLGTGPDGHDYLNKINFPPADLDIRDAAPIYEIRNPFPFCGATFIHSTWADARAKDPCSIRLQEPEPVVLRDAFPGLPNDLDGLSRFIEGLPAPFKITLAVCGTDPMELSALAHTCCKFVLDGSGKPVGMRYVRDATGGLIPEITALDVFEALANNPNLPDSYKKVMVLFPGAQGKSPVIGEWYNGGRTHVFEYLRANSYIPWGHFAANMAHDSIRYSLSDMTMEDMSALRHLYYQRTYLRLSRLMGLDPGTRRRRLSNIELEDLRCMLYDKLKNARTADSLAFDRTLWGWNFGFDYAPTGYRLHGSHQQIHQQYALIPGYIPSASASAEKVRPFACGDMVAEFIKRYQDAFGVRFFDAFLSAVENNTRTDGKDELPESLVVFSDKNVILYVPKAQTSQWEVQVVSRQPVGNILEADSDTRRSLDKALFLGARALGVLGVRMVHFIEYSKPFCDTSDRQHILYSVLPRLPESPGAFTEAQRRYISGHYPEDFAFALRCALSGLEDAMDACK